MQGPSTSSVQDYQTVRGAGRQHGTRSRSSTRPAREPRTETEVRGLNGYHRGRAPVAQWIERRPPEPSRLSVVATRVGPRAKRVEFYALRSPAEALDQLHGPL